MSAIWGDSESWGLLLGFLAPLAIAIIEQPTWSRTARWVVGWACAIIIGLVTCLANGDFTHGATVLRTIVLVIAASEATYTGWRKAVTPAIETATSPGAAKVPPR
jgi:hypothetical protein